MRPMASIIRRRQETPNRRLLPPFEEGQSLILGMADRKKVEKDPLRDLFSDDSNNGLFSDQNLVSDKHKDVSKSSLWDTNTDDAFFREIDASKVKFKDRKANSTATVPPTMPSKVDVVPPASSSVNHSGLAANSGLGFNVSLWDHESGMQRNFSKGLDDILGNSKVETTLNDGLFGTAKQTTSASAPATGKATKLRVLAEDDDENISTLKVSKILEREEYSEPSLYGKNVSRSVPSTLLKEELDISKFDEILSIEKSIDKNPTQVQGTNKKITSSKSEDVVDDIDITSFDLNSYISQQKNDSGGLFD